jgi:TRAP-type C4-dicarboxylate transport system substrate-binding protein
VGRDEQRKVGRELSDKSLAKLKQSGMQVTELTPDVQARLREMVKPVYERHGETIGKETVAKVQEELARIRKQ